MDNIDIEDIITHKISDLMITDDSALIEDILQILTELESNFINKKFDYFYKTDIKSPQQTLSIAFLPPNIMHLIGIKSYSIQQPITSGTSKTPSYSREFYADFRNGCLDFDKCWVESLNKVTDKLNALKHLPEIITENVRIGGSGDYMKLTFSNLLRTNRAILGIAITKSDSEYSVPISTLNLITDKRAREHTAFTQAVCCSKLRISTRLDSGLWQVQETIPFINNTTNKKKRKKKKK